MKENVSNGNPVTPMLFPYEPEKFWQSIRQIIREEVQSIDKQKTTPPEVCRIWRTVELLRFCKNNNCFQNSLGFHSLGMSVFF